MRIGIVNDMVMVAECLRRSVVAYGNHEVAWVASDGAQAVACCKQDRPDLILMDLHMPVLDGVEATRRIMQESPCPILIVTSSVAENAAMVFDAMGAGAVDAVDTPLGACSSDTPQVRELLDKVRLIGQLSGTAFAPKSVNRSADEQFPLVILGASSGGPQALASIVAKLPASFPAAVVVVQHVDAKFAPELANWLGLQAQMNVTMVRPGEMPRAGEILVAATDDHLTLTAGGRLAYCVQPAQATYKPSVDVFFDAVLAHWNGPVAAVLLSGMGRDGAEAMTRLRKRGALTLAQDEASCAVFGMPRAAIELGAACHVASPEGIAEIVVSWVYGQRRAIPVPPTVETLAPTSLTSCEPAASSSNSLPGELAAENHHIRVLLVDDQLMVHEGFRRMVRDVDDFDLHFCSDPNAALATAQRLHPTVILQDLVMPGMDGLMLLSLLRSNPATHQIPVIVLSTKEDPKIKSEAFAIGASDYLVKFPDRIELLARIRAHARSYLAQQQRDYALQQLRALKVNLERKNAELEALSCSDGLTGVLNRRGFDNFLNKEWLRAVREHRHLGLLLIDLDHFKDYNDHYGHQDGDECLRRVASALGAGLKRASDSLARYGGEEFAIILPDTDVDGCAAIADGLRHLVAELNLRHEYSSVASHVTVSIGAASLMPTPGDSVHELIRHADLALYRAKAAGRNGYSVFYPQ